MKRISRRTFVKKAAVVTAGIAASPTLFIRKSRASWAKKTAVHPNVDNLRVVSVTDPKMTRGVEPASSWKRQEELVDKRVIWENMDRLACGLTGTGSEKDAWRTLFVKPPRKSWSDTVVAIKTNNIGRQHTRSPLMAKICHTLTGMMGVKAHNIHIYDACHGGNMKKNTPFAGLPDGCRIEDRWGGMTAFTKIPEPAQDMGEESECLKYLVDGTVDILINVAMCKGHSHGFGGFTMTMKNHFGTFSPRPGHHNGGFNYLIAINQTPEILGEMDKRSGKVLFPRQQLCIVDALWASKCGPGCKASHQPNFIAMGVLSPVVDYQVATKFRGERMDWQPNRRATQKMLGHFGYFEDDLPEGGKLIELS